MITQVKELHTLRVDFSRLYPEVVTLTLGSVKVDSVHFKSTYLRALCPLFKASAEQPGAEIQGKNHIIVRPGNFR